MGTATSRRAAAGIAAAALGLAACGGHRPARQAAPSPSFGWLNSARAPTSWPRAKIPAGAAMPYPPGWTSVPGDPGTATVALFGARHTFVGYLNLTPKQGAETLADWNRFRVDHNAEEGDRNVRTLASTTGHRLKDATASCVEDSYSTITRASYVEIACLFANRRTTVVAVGASPPADWPRIQSSLERAIASVPAA